MDIDLAHARWRLGALPIAQAETLATWALTVGYDGPALRELAWAHDSWVEADELFQRAMAEMKRPALDLETATVVLVTQVARQIVAGTLAPAEGAGMVYWDLFPHTFHTELPPQVRQFLDLADEYDAAVRCEDQPWEETTLTQLLEAARALVTTGLEPGLARPDDRTGLEPSLE